MTVETLQQAKSIEKSIKQYEDRAARLKVEVAKLEGDKVTSDELMDMTFRTSNTLEVNAKRLYCFLMAEYDICNEMIDEFRNELAAL